MDNTIIASFESVDIATAAVRDARRRFDDIRVAKIRHKVTEDTGHGDIGMPAFFAPTDVSTPVQQNGIMPIGFVPPVFSVMSKSEDYSRGNAVVYITATEKNANKICMALRHNGAMNITVR